MELNDIKSVYFVGAGGIGMSAIARYFLHRGLIVAGYDRTPSALTEKLKQEGMDIHYEDDIKAIPEACLDKASTLVIYTPAIPADPNHPFGNQPDTSAGVVIDPAKVEVPEQGAAEDDGTF